MVEDRLSLEGDDGAYFVQYYAPDLGLIIRTTKIGPDGKPLSGVELDTIAPSDG